MFLKERRSKSLKVNATLSILVEYSLPDLARRHATLHPTQTLFGVRTYAVSSDVLWDRGRKQCSVTCH